MSANGINVKATRALETLKDSDYVIVGTDNMEKPLKVTVANFKEAMGTGSEGGDADEQDLASVLTEGNETDGNDIVISDGDVINSASGGGQLNLRYGGDNEVFLSNNSGDYDTEQLYLSPGYVELSSYSNGGYIGIYTNNSGNDTSDNFVGHYIFSPSLLKYSKVGFETNSSDYISKFGAKGANNNDGFNIYAGAINDQISTPINNGGNTVISSPSAILVPGLSNTVVLGGLGITATQSNSVYISQPVVISASAPANTADSSGVQGEIRYDSDYFYIKTAAGWKRTALSTF